MYTRPRRTASLRHPSLISLYNVCWPQPPPVRSATKAQVVSQIHWAYSSPPSTLQSIVYTRFTAAYRDIGREKIETNNKAEISAGPISQISADIYPLPDYYHIFAAADE